MLRARIRHRNDLRRGRLRHVRGREHGPDGRLAVIPQHTPAIGQAIHDAEPATAGRSRGRLGDRGSGPLPASLTATRSASSLSVQVTLIREPGSGAACRIALLSSSLTTSAASQTTDS